MGREKRSKFANDAKSNAQLAASLAQKTTIPANTIIILGDSITAQHIYNDIGGVWSTSSRGYFSWANVLLRHRFKLLAVKGVGGQRSDQILARVESDIINNNPKPRWCLVEAGVNDIGQGVSRDAIIENLQQIYSKLINKGIKVIATTITPTTSANTQERLETLNLVNRWIKIYCQANSDIVLCDWHGVLTNPSTGLPITGVMTDGVHPNVNGASLMGKALFDTLKNITPNVDLLINTNFEKNLIPNGMMTGNNAGVATGWTIYTDAGTTTPSKVTRTDGLQGEWQQIVGTGATCNLHNQNQNVGVDWNFGDKVFGQCEFETDNDWSNVTNFGLQIIFTGTAASSGDLISAGSDEMIFLRPSSGVLRTPEVVIPTGTTKIQFKVYFKGTGTIRLAKCQLGKV